MTVLMTIFITLGYLAVGYLAWFVCLRTEVHLLGEKRLEYTFFGDDAGPPMAVLLWPLILGAAALFVVFYPFLKLHRILRRRMEMSISQDLPMERKDYERIMSKILYHKEILPTLIGIDKELDFLIGKISSEKK